MPPRYAYWTIILEGKPTAFRAQQREELLPTFKQLQAKHPDAVMMWFARGRLWTSPEEADARRHGAAPATERADGVAARRRTPRSPRALRRSARREAPPLRGEASPRHWRVQRTPHPIRTPRRRIVRRRSRSRSPAQSPAGPEADCRDRRPPESRRPPMARPVARSRARDRFTAGSQRPPETCRRPRPLEAASADGCRSSARGQPFRPRSQRARKDLPADRDRWKPRPPMGADRPEIASHSDPIAAVRRSLPAIVPVASREERRQSGSARSRPPSAGQGGPSDGVKGRPPQGRPPSTQAGSARRAPAGTAARGTRSTPAAGRPGRSAAPATAPADPRQGPRDRPQPASLAGEAGPRRRRERGERQPRRPGPEEAAAAGAAAAADPEAAAGSAMIAHVVLFKPQSALAAGERRRDPATR